MKHIVNDLMCVLSDHGIVDYDGMKVQYVLSDHGIVDYARTWYESTI